MHTRGTRLQRTDWPEVGRVRRGIPVLKVEPREHGGLAVLAQPLLELLDPRRDCRTGRDTTGRDQKGRPELRPEPLAAKSNQASNNALQIKR